MALRTPTRDELKQIAKDNHFELTDQELAMLRPMLEAIIPQLQQVDATPNEKPPSVTKYRDRNAGARPDRKDDPYNAIMRRCSVKGAASGKLAGKRIGVKDSVCVAGIPVSAGSRVLEDYVPDFDATIVSRMLEAGGEIVATLVMDDFALSGDGTTSAYGPTLNPHKAEHCSGGSSCGSGAALSYDWIDITIGTDQGGSIRIPAAWCGVVGIKPSYSLVPYTGVMSIDPTLDHVGPMARTVRDVALALEVMAGADPLDPRQRDVRVQPYCDALGQGVSGMRLGVLREGFEHPGGEADVNAAVRKAVAALEQQGAKVEEVSIPEHRAAVRIFWGLVAEGMANLANSNLTSTHFQGFYNTGLADAYAAGMVARGKHIAPTVKIMLLMGNYLQREYHGRIYGKSQNQRPTLRARYDAVLARFDALVMPTIPMKAHRRDQPAPYMMLGNTAPFDVSGHPAISVPCALSQGLPVGLMFVGRQFDESTLFRLAGAYERSVDWRKA